MSSDRLMELIQESNSNRQGDSYYPDLLRQLYSSMISTDALPLVVFEIEHIPLLIHALPPKLRHLARDYYNLFIRSLTATRSINGALIKELTQTKVRYEYDGDVKGKKDINKMFAPKDGQE